ncbi:MAG: tetratricopeptide repeat protein [Phycisphaerae bacterium]|nr:tetratricopeptide repeat protein [Phycisphaerae bacterium]
MSKKGVNTAVVAVLAVVVLLLAVKRFAGVGDAEGPQNVLLITLDTTRADHVGCYGYSEALTPALDELAAKGVLFEQAFSSVPMTLPSHATIMTGLQPPEHGLRVNGEDRLDPSFVTLAAALRDQGYDTGAFIASFTLDSQNGLDQGFNTYDDDLTAAYPHHADEPLTAYRPGDLVTDSALAWIEQRNEDQPFFCWVHLFDPHKPYFAHDVLRDTRYAGQETYDAEIAFMDRQVRRLTDFLREEGLVENTLVVAVADHGEGLDEHREPTHGYMVYETTLSVPLIISQPGKIKAGHRVGAMVSLTDLLPTILDCLGLKAMDDLPGRSLKGALLGEEIESIPCYAESYLPYSFYGWSPLFSLTTPRWKYIHSRRRHLYDRQADPGELANLATDRPDIVAQLAEELEEIRKAMVVHVAEKVSLSPEDRARLDAMGYMGGGRVIGGVKDVDVDELQDLEDRLDVLGMTPRMRDLARRGEIAQLKAIAGEMLRLSPESAQIRCDLAEALVNAGEVEDGIREYEEYLNDEAGDDAVHYTLGVILGRQKRFSEAARHFRMAVQLNPKEVRYWERAGVALRDSGDFEGAVRHFTEALRLRPDDAMNQYNLGTVLEKQGDLEGAVRHYNRARALNPVDFQTPRDVGQILVRQKRFPEAIDYYSKALEADPSDAAKHIDLAGVYEQAGDLEKAASHCSEAVRLQPDDPKWQYKLGTLLGKQGQLEEAVKHLSKALELDPANVSAMNNLGLVFVRQGKLAEAIEHLSKVLQIQPDNALAHLNLGDVYLRQGRPADAVQQYSEAVRVDPDNALAHKGLGLALGMERKFDEAIKHFTEALRLKPEDWNARFLRGNMLEAKKLVREAVAEYKAALEVSPEQPQVANSLAWILATHPEEEVRNAEDAVKFAELACKGTDYGDPGTLDTLAAAYAAAGRFEEAVATARKALALLSGPRGEQLSKEIQERLELYEAGRAYHVGP